MKFNLARTIMKNMVWNFICASNRRNFLLRFGFFNRLFFHYPIRCYLDSYGKDFIVKDADNEEFTFTNMRMIGRYKNGVASRLHGLASEYLIDSCDLQAGDLVIDIGANIGEFSRYCGQVKGANVVCFEPEADCLGALEQNLAGLQARIIPTALWKEQTQLQIYHSPVTNDTSLIEPESFDWVETIEVQRLDDVMATRFDSDDEIFDTSRIKLMKVEAEGAEPEIIAGALHTLARVEYVTVDCGPERGIAKSSTLVPVLNLLLNAGFELRDFSVGRCVVLMKNAAIS